ncbi:hypothetical protein L6452_34198 [Arctium lappa]|uniref:Uncharacterized protein n=1 Tax=Arctium lappa TaxID=4217 RepID=A0ACB8YI55_ARCLA|nr:hypothetical protein L6452_34198 [Arctium lappa]
MSKGVLEGRLSYCARTLGEEYRIVAPPPVILTTTNPTIPVYHPSTAPAVADASYVGGLNSGNIVPPVANWLPRMLPPVTSGIPLLPGYGYNINLPPRGYDHGLAPVVGGGGGNASDHTSDEGGDDSVVSGRKVKFLCSFGEDLDALVTVSRPDDLENMMDEYDKLVERYSDGSAKLRVFLFTELESSSVIRFKDLQDSGQKYVEAVNGIRDGFGGTSGGGGGSSSGAGIGRKGSIASASSTQNSDSATGVPVAKSVTVPASPSQSDYNLEISERMVPGRLSYCARTLGEEYRIVAPPPPVTLTTTNPTVPIYHPSTASAAADAAYVGGLNSGNVVPPVANWLLRLPPPVTSGIPLLPGYGYNINLPPCGYDHGLAPVVVVGGGNASDHTSDEGGDDSVVSGRKVKFLCSFGGKILPRPSDGVLRYVGGDTRIISVRRDVGFNELVQKMFDSYGQNVIIKYQLPKEDLDALVTVSRLDDLENMMDEYDKLVERYSDGSAKLKVFLFTELESSSVIRFKDLQDSGQKYVEAENGIGDGFGGSSGSGGGSSSGAGIGRKGSIASASSTQNSDSATGVPVAKSVTVPNSPSQSDYDLEILERMVPVHIQQQQQRQLAYDLQQPGATIPPPAPYVQSYVDPRHGNVATVYAQPQLHDNVVGMTRHKFIPPMHMTTPSSHISFKPNPVPIPVPVPVLVPQIVQQQEVRMDHFPEEHTFGQRIVHLSSDQSYTTYQPQPQVPPPVIPGSYGWNLVPSPEQVPFF